MKNNENAKNISLNVRKLESKTNINEYLCKYTIKAHKLEITCMTLLKTNEEIATGSLDKKIKIWKISKIDYNILLLSELEGHKDGILSLLYIINSNKLLSTSKDKTIKIWDIKYLNCIQTLRYHESSVYACYYNPLITPLDIISGGEDKNIVIWSKIFNTNNKNIEYNVKSILKGHDDSVLSLLFIVEKKYLISGSKDKSIRIWDYEYNYNCVNVLNELNTEIYCLKYNFVKYNINKNILICSCEDGNIYFIDINKIKLIKSIQFSKYSVKNFDINENQLLIASFDYKGRIWNFENKQKETLRGHNKGLTSIIKLNNEVIITSSLDNNIKIWSKENSNK